MSGSLSPSHARRSLTPSSPPQWSVRLIRSTAATQNSPSGSSLDCNVPLPSTSTRDFSQAPINSLCSSSRSNSRRRLHTSSRPRSWSPRRGRLDSRTPFKSTPPRRSARSALAVAPRLPVSACSTLIRVAPYLVSPSPTSRPCSPNLRSRSTTIRLWAP